MINYRERSEWSDWGEWSDWSECSMSCGVDGQREKVRECAVAGQCVGNSSERGICNEGSCCKYY